MSHQGQLRTMAISYSHPWKTKSRDFESGPNSRVYVLATFVTTGGPRITGVRFTPNSVFLGNVPINAEREPGDGPTSDGLYFFLNSTEGPLASMYPGHSQWIDVKASFDINYSDGTEDCTIIEVKLRITKSSPVPLPPVTQDISLPPVRTQKPKIAASTTENIVLKHQAPRNAQKPKVARGNKIEDVTVILPLTEETVTDISLK